MKIKSLLLGSAAAVIAVSGASAADAIVAAEPEPVEYVRVCDAFGNGYFFIPGTETCLRISGYVRFQVGSNSEADSWENSQTATRARVQFDSRSDTEWGELAARVRLQGTWNTNNDGPNISASSVSTATGTGVAVGDPINTTVATSTTGSSNVIDQAWLRLGGLFMGYSESYWANAYNTGSSNFGSHSDNGLAYGYQQRHLIGYTFNNGTFFLAVSVEDDDDSTNYTPDFTGKLGAVFGGATVWIKAAYDESRVIGGVAADAVSGGVGLNVDLGPGNVILLGYYADGQTAYGANLSFAGSTWTPEWSVIASYGMDLGATLYGSIQGQYFWDFYSPAVSGLNLGVDAWSIEGSLVWTPVTNFEIRTEVTYTDVDTLGDLTQGYLRFQRNF